MSSDRTGRKRRCPTGKLKIFNKAWADITAEDQSQRFGSLFRSYQCSCGWWHTYDRTKRHRKEYARESSRDRRKRAARGEPSARQIQAMEEERIRRREKQRRQRRRKSQERQLAVSTWEDDGGYIPASVERPVT